MDLAFSIDAMETSTTGSSELELTVHDSCPASVPSSTLIFEMSAAEIMSSSSSSSSRLSSVSTRGVNLHSIAAAVAASASGSDPRTATLALNLANSSGETVPFSSTSRSSMSSSAD